MTIPTHLLRPLSLDASPPCIPRPLLTCALATLLGLGTIVTSKAQTLCEPTIWDLTAGQTINVGSVEVRNDEVNLYVTYSLDYLGASFDTLHLWVGCNLADVPSVSSGPNAGTPIPGQFPYIHDATGLTEYTFTIPLTDILCLGEESCDLPVFVVTHAEVINVAGKDETAFGGDQPGPGPRWWFYGSHTICCEDDPVEEEECFTNETAWAAGSRYVTRGNWATYTPYAEVSTTFYAGQTYDAGTVSFSGVVDDVVTITIQLNAGFIFADVEENLKIQGYAAPPSGNPSPGLFAYKFTVGPTSAIVEVPAASYYGIHGDLLRQVECPPEEVIP